MENPITLQELQALSKTLADLHDRGLTAGSYDDMHLTNEVDFIRLSVGCPVTSEPFPKLADGTNSPFIHHTAKLNGFTLTWLQEGSE